jgi:hypothetical protein
MCLCLSIEIIYITHTTKIVPQKEIMLVGQVNISPYFLASYDCELLSSKESGLVYRGVDE